MTFEEIVEHYRVMCENWPGMKGRKVFRRDEIHNTDPGISRRGGWCICGTCHSDGKVCACGEDRVLDGQNCLTCKRPWWCER